MTRVRASCSILGYSRSIELAREQVHEQAVPPRSIRRTPVLAHDADRTEADFLVGSDRRDVVGRRVDSEPVVSPLVDQVARERSHRVGSKPLLLGPLGVSVNKA